MTEMLVEAFERERGRLVAVAHRMLGSRADAEDAVQEAWLRLARQDVDTIGNLAGWLTTVVGRVSIDVLRARRAASYELVLPAEAGAPEDDAVLAESVGQALLVVLDTLGPAERLAFVLHDLFGVPFDEIGQILGRSADAAKMLASRARRKVRGSPRPAGEEQQRRAVVDAFVAAAQRGDFAELLRLLDPEVTWRSYTRKGVVVRLGATEVVARSQHGIRAAAIAEPILVNGEPGLLARTASGVLLGVVAFTVVDRQIVEILSVRDPELLADMGVAA